ncbi:MAG: hypothetical protein ACR2KW_03270 [Rubrobacter sp.]
MLPDRPARCASDGEDQASGRSEFVRAVYEAAGGSCAQPVEMRPLARRLGLDPRAVENLAMRLQAERLVRVVSMANGLLRLTPEGVCVTEGAAEDVTEGAAEDVTEGAAEDVTEDAAEGAGSGPDPVPPVVGRGALRELEGMLDPLKVALDRLDLGGALDEEQRSELAAEIRTIEAQLGSPKPKRRIVVAALESVEDIVWSAAGAAGGAGSETESKKILRAIDAFLGGVGGSGQTGRAARGARGSSGEAANKAQAGRGAQGARNGAGLVRPGGDLGAGPGARCPEEESATTARAREAGGVRVRKWIRGGGVRVRKRVRKDGGWVTEQAQGAGLPAGEGANGMIVEVGKGVGSAVEGVGEGADQAVRGAGGAAGRDGDAADRAAAQEAEAATTARRGVDVSGDILRTTLNEDGEILDEDVIGNVADLPIENKYVDEQGRTIAGVKDAAGNAYRLVLDERGSLVDAVVVGTVDVGDQQVGQADGAVQQTTGLLGEKMKGVQDTAYQGAGAAEDLAPNWLQGL